MAIIPDLKKCCLLGFTSFQKSFKKHTDIVMNKGIPGKPIAVTTAYNI